MFLEVVTSLLLAGAPETASNATTPAERPAEKKICRTQVETGSLVKGKKMCFTKKQWQQLADAQRAEVERTASMGSQSGQ
jgi:2-keto-4-pentenoate hydratase